MKYRVTHVTTYDYGESVPICQNQVHLTPRDDADQTCLEHRLIIDPAPSSIGQRTDYFGNKVTMFSVTEGHDQLKVTAFSTVDVHRKSPCVQQRSARWESVRDSLPATLSERGLQTYQFCFPSQHVRCAQRFGDYARQSFTEGRPILESLHDLTQRIHREFIYDAHATTVSTPVEEVFKNRRGVCQDLAHLQIACLRSLKLAARYVSGYLRTVPPAGQARLIGADASHAWVSVYCGEAGWIDVDPTNNLFPSSDHITVAWGRDYADVCPINGMFVGRGRHQMEVAVKVDPVS